MSHLDNQRITWINIDGLGDIDVLRTLGSQFNLHPLALEDVLATGQRPKVEQYDGYLFIVAQMLYLNHGKANVRRTGQHVSREKFPHHPPGGRRTSTSSSRCAPGFAQPTAPFANRALIISPTRCSIPSSIITIRCWKVSARRSTQSKTSWSIAPHSESGRAIFHRYKRTLTQIRRFIWPVRDLVKSMMHEETGLVTKGTKVYLRDCYDHTVQLMDLVESYRDVLSGLMELYLSSVGIRTNEIMKVLTVISSIFIPLTFIVGVYGMNFAREVDGKKLPWNMPELYQP